MSVRAVDIFFEVVVLLFAISVHESAHAWMANRLGDPTAKMLGRISLNPLDHIDPFGTILFPAMLILMHLPPFGWAKPTPVDSRNFKRQVRDDIFTALAGPASNFVTAFLAIVGIALIVHFTAMGAPGPIGPGIFRGAEVASPLARMLEFAITINVVLGVFNLVPLPPLDGSHVLRHFLPYNSLQTYDRIGYFGLVILFFVLPLMGISVLDVFINPVMMLFEYLLRILIF